MPPVSTSTFSLIFCAFISRGPLFNEPRPCSSLLSCALSLRSSRCPRLATRPSVSAEGYHDDCITAMLSHPLLATLKTSMWLFITLHLSKQFPRIHRILSGFFVVEPCIHCFSDSVICVKNLLWCFGITRQPLVLIQQYSSLDVGAARSFHTKRGERGYFRFCTAIEIGLTI